MDTLCGGGKAKQAAEEVHTDQICFGVGGDRLMCHEDSILDDGSSSGATSTASPKKQASVFLKPMIDESCHVVSRIRHRVYRARSAASTIASHVNLYTFCLSWLYGESLIVLAYC
jgi:hypothetical protein